MSQILIHLLQFASFAQLICFQDALKAMDGHISVPFPRGRNQQKKRSKGQGNEMSMHNCEQWLQMNSDCKVLQRQKSLPFVYKAMLGATSQLRNACHPFMACNLLITQWQGTLIQDGPPREDGGSEEQC